MREKGPQTIERLKTSFIAVLLVSILVVGAIVSIAAGYPFSQHLKDDANRGLLEAVKNKKTAITRFLSELEQDAWQMSLSTNAGERLERLNRGEVGLRQYADSSAPGLSNALRLSSEAVGCVRFDRNGNAVVQAGMPIPRSFRMFPGETDDGARVEGLVTTTDEPYVVVRVPISNQKGVQVGTDLVMYRTDELRRIVRDQTGLGTTGESVLGMMEDGGRCRTLFTSERDAGAHVDIESPIGMAIERASHLGVGEDGLLTPPIDRSWVLAYSSVPGAESLAIVIQMNAGELYAPINRQVVTHCLVVFALLLLGTLGTAVWLRPLAGKMIVRTEDLEHTNRQLVHDREERTRANAINAASMRLMQFASSHSLDDFLEETLNQAEELTRSRISFYVFVEEDQATLTLQNWSTRTKAEFCRAKGKGLHYSISEAGVWADCIARGQPVVHNDYASLPHRKGTPEGHAELVRELVVPIRRGDKTMAVIAVGNKPEDYNTADVEAVSTLADLTWEIAERKRAEEKVLRSDQRLRLHSEQSPLGFLEWDNSFCAVEWNAACERIFGYTREEAIGRHAKDLILPVEVHDLVDGIYQSLMNQTGGVHSVNENVTKDGRLITCEWFNTTLMGKDGNAIGVASVCRDITEQKRMELELARYRERLEEQVAERTAELEIAKNKAQQYLDVAGVMLVAIEKDQKITLINQKGCETLGGSAGEIVGKNWFETFVPERQRRAVTEAFLRLVAGELGAVEYYENPVLTRDGEERLIAWHNALLRDGEGNVMGTLSSGEDITETRRAEQQIIALNRDLRKRAEALEAANTELEAFAYSISHDLRAPLRHIDGFLRLMQKHIGAGLDQQATHYMRSVSDAALKMGRMIDDLLSFSRMGRQAMSLGEVELRSLVQDILKDLEPDTRGRDIDWRIDELPLVRGDRAMLRIVLVNLMSNALKFTGPREQARIEIGSTAGEGSEAVVFVRDNGVGFDMSFADRLFGVFQRLHHADEFEGTGIGLANVLRIVKRHGGRAWAEGKTGQGATFFFSLPSASAERSETSLPQREDRSSGPEGGARRNRVQPSQSPSGRM